jgi:hypothetical protein
MTIDDKSRPLRRAAREGSRDGRGSAAGSNVPLPERLKGAREARGVDLFRVERDTRIRIKYLSAMEEGDFSALPGDVYVRGFLRNYASYLGLDPDEAEAEWRRGNVAPRVTRRPSPPAAASSPGAATQPAAPQVRLPSLKLPSLRMPGRGVAQTASSAGVGGASADTDAAAAGTDPAATEALSAAGSTNEAIITAGPGTAPDSGASAAAGGLLQAGETVPEVELRQIDLTGEVDATGLESGLAPAGGWKSRLPALRRPELPGFFRRGADDAATEPFRGPEPLAAPRRSFLLQPAHLIVLALCVVIVGMAGFFAVQAQRVLQDPTLSITAPDQGFTEVSTGTRTYRLEGKSIAKAKISISLDQRTVVDTQADASGNWSYEVTLHTGVNQIDIYSTDLSTNHKSITVTRYLSVPEPTASPPPLFLTVDSPVNGESSRSGKITVTGTTVAVEYVTVTPTYMGPPPSNLSTPTPVATASPTEIPTLMPLPTATPKPSGSLSPTPRPTPSNAPSPVQVIPTVDGKFAAEIDLYSGTWRLTVVGSDKMGLSTEPVNVTVIVTAGSLTVVIQAKGGSPQVKIWRDGKLLPGWATYTALHAGKSVTVVADQSVTVATGIPRYTYVTVNGVSFGQLSAGRSLASWRMTAFAPPTLTNDR